jgi:fused signal recognition particle receptor
MEQTPDRDPFEFLANAGSDEGLWLFLAGPVGILLLVALVYVVLVWRKRKREDADLKKEVEAADDHKVVTLPHDRGLGEPEYLDQGEPFELPEELEEEPGHKRPALEVVRPVPAAPGDVEDIRKTDRASWLGRLRSGLAKTRDSLRGSLQGIFTGKTRIDAGVLERLHEALYRADIGAETTDKLVQHVRTTLAKDEGTSWEAVAAGLKDEAKRLLEKPQDAALKRPTTGPWVILVVGVNGVGKTTTIGKLGAHFLAEDKKVLLAAGDTFRAAAIEQLQRWGDRLGVDVVKHKQGSDPAAVAYDAVKAAQARTMDVLLIDTAGRLHARTELMAELGKINRVIGKDLPEAPHETWLVIDATTGQNAVQQVKAFREVVNVTGLIVTKLDGTAKGGVLLGIADQFGLPIRYVGVGEKASDLRTFNAADYVESLF